MKDCNICVNWSGISSYKVLDCPETTVWAGHYRENAYKYPMGSSGPLPYALALSGEQNLCCGWDNNLWGFSVHHVPNKTASQITYDIPTMGITGPSNMASEEIVLPKQGISKTDNVIIGNQKDGGGGSNPSGDPCPGGTGYFLQGAKKVRCFYSKTDDGQSLRTLSPKTNPDLKQMHNTLSEEFCNVRDNITKNPGGSSCWDRKHGTDLAREYCGVGNRITSDICDIGAQKHIGRQVYDDLATAYCNTSEGIWDEWCACKNVMKESGEWCKNEYNVRNNSDKPGCKDVIPHYNALLAAIPEEFRGNFGRERLKCMKNVCSEGVRWVPREGGLQDQCENNTQICQMSVEEITNSEIGNINLECNQTLNTNQTDDKTASDNAILERLKQLEEQNKKLSEEPSPSSPSSSPSSSPPSPSTTDNNNYKKMGGVSFSSCCCLILLLLIVLMMDDDEINNSININNNL